MYLLGLTALVERLVWQFMSRSMATIQDHFSKVSLAQKQQSPSPAVQSLKQPGIMSSWVDKQLLRDRLCLRSITMVISLLVSLFRAMRQLQVSTTHRYLHSRRQRERFNRRPARIWRSLSYICSTSRLIQLNQVTIYETRELTYDVDRAISHDMQQNQRNMRKTSLSVSSSQKSSKPAFQTKLKHRTSSNNKAVNDSLLRSLQNQVNGVPPSRDSLVSSQQDSPQKTPFKLSQEELAYSQERYLKSYIPEITKKTVYKQQYERKTMTPTQPLNTEDHGRLKGPNLQMASTYSKGFIGREGDRLERPKPDNLIPSSKLCASLTNYSYQFPGHKCGNQYVKPTDRHHRASFPLRSKSTYSCTFIRKQAEREGNHPVDLLKTGSNWLGETTYKQKFSEQNPEYYPLKIKFAEKQENNPDYKRQYETIYRNDYVPKVHNAFPSIHFSDNSRSTFKDALRQKIEETGKLRALPVDHQQISIQKQHLISP